MLFYIKWLVQGLPRGICLRKDLNEVLELSWLKTISDKRIVGRKPHDKGILGVFKVYSRCVPSGETTGTRVV